MGVNLLLCLENLWLLFKQVEKETKDQLRSKGHRGPMQSNMKHHEITEEPATSSWSCNWVDVGIFLKLPCEAKQLVNDMFLWASLYVEDGDLEKCVISLEDCSHPVRFWFGMIRQETTSVRASCPEPDQTCTRCKSCKIKGTSQCMKVCFLWAKERQGSVKTEWWIWESSGHCSPSQLTHGINNLENSAAMWLVCITSPPLSDSHPSAYMQRGDRLCGSYCEMCFFKAISDFTLEKGGGTCNPIGAFWNSWPHEYYHVLLTIHVLIKVIIITY